MIYLYLSIVVFVLFIHMILTHARISQLKDDLRDERNGRFKNDDRILSKVIEVMRDMESTIKDSK